MSSFQGLVGVVSQTSETAAALAQRLAEYSGTGAPALVWSVDALVDAERAIDGAATDESAAQVWRMVASLHAARAATVAEATVEGEIGAILYAAAFTLDPDAVPDNIRNALMRLSAQGSAGYPNWAGLAMAALQIVDVDGYPHIRKFVRALVARSLATDSGTALDELGQALVRQASLSRFSEWSEDAITVLRRGPATPRVALDLATALVARFRLRHDAGDLDEAVGLLQESVDRLSGGGVSGNGADYGRALGMLGLALDQRYGLTGDPADDADALTYLRAAITADPSDHPAMPSRHNNLGSSLLRRFEEGGADDRLDEAIEVLRTATNSGGGDRVENSVARANLGRALLLRNRRSPTREAVDEAIAYLGRAAQELPIEHPEWANTQSALGHGLVELSDLAEDSALLQEAVGVHFRAALFTADEHPAATFFRAELANVLQLTIAVPEANAADGIMNEQIAGAYLQAVTIPLGTPEWHESLLVLLSLVNQRAERSRFAVPYMRAELDVASVVESVLEHPAVRQVHLDALVRWYLITGNPVVLAAARERAVDPAEVAAVEEFSADPVQRWATLSDLVWYRFLHTKDATDLENAVAVMREAVAHAPDEHPQRLTLRRNLANSLLRKAIVANTGPAISEAIEEARAVAAQARDVDQSIFAECGLLIGRGLLQELRHTNEAEQADERVRAIREAMDLSPGAPFRGEALATLAEALTYRGETYGDRDDLHDAVSTARQALEVADEGSRNIEVVRHALLGALISRFEAEHDGADLAEVLTMAGANATEPTVFSTLQRLLTDPTQLDQTIETLDTSRADEIWNAALALGITSGDDDLTVRLLDLAERLARRRQDLHEVGAQLQTAGMRLADQGRFRTAIVILSRAVAVFADAGSVYGEAYALSRIGLCHEDLEEWPESLAVFERSAALFHDLEQARPEILQVGNMGIVCTKAGDLDRAVALHRRTIELCQRAGLVAEEASYQGHLAEAYRRGGDFAAVAEHVGQARLLYQRAGDAGAAADALHDIAAAELALGRFAEADEHALMGVQEFVALGEPNHAQWALVAHVSALLTIGRVAEAGSLEDRATAMGGTTDAAQWWDELGGKHRAVGDMDGARRAFSQAVDGYLASGMRSEAAAAQQRLGFVHLLRDDTPLALAALQTSADWFRQADAPGLEAGVRVLIARSLQRQGALMEAEAEATAAVDLAARSGERLPLCLAFMQHAEIERAIGRREAAWNRLIEVVRLAEEDPVTYAFAKHGLAELAREEEDLDAEIDELEAAVAALRRGGVDPIAAVVSIKLGHALEERGDISRARSALEFGLAHLDPLVVDEIGTAHGLYFERVTNIDKTMLRLRIARLKLAEHDIVGASAVLGHAVPEDAAGNVARVHALIQVEAAQNRGDFAGALDLARQALSGIGDAGAEEYRTALLALVSRLLQRTGDLVGAYDSARELCAMERSPENLRQFGSTARTLGRLDEAITYLAEAEELARAGGERLELAAVLNSLGLTCQERGQWQRAMRAYDEGLSLTTGSARLRGSLLQNRAGLHRYLGQLDASIDGYLAAIEIIEEYDDERALVSCYADLAAVYRELGDVGKAMPLVERALAVERERGDLHGVVIDLNLLGGMRITEPVAEDYLQESLAIARQIGDATGQMHALANLGTRHLFMHEYRQAHDRFTEALSVSETAGSSNNTAMILVNRAVATQRMGDLPAALADASQACRLFQALYRGVHTTPRSTRDDSARQAQDLVVELSARLGECARAWQEAERAKAYDFAGHIGLDNWPEPAGVDAEVLRAEQRLLAQSRALFADAENATDPMRRKAHLTRLSSVQTELDELWRSIEPVAGPYVALRRGDPAEPADAVGQQGQIGILAFHVSDVVTVMAYRTGWPQPRAYVTAVTPDSLRPLISAHGREQPALLDHEGQQVWVDLTEVLAEWLLGEAVRDLGTGLDLLYLIPDRDLHNLPLHAFPVDGLPLLERSPVAYAPSAATLVKLHAKDTGSNMSLVMGFTDDPDEEAAVEGEANDAAAHLGVHAFLGAQATHDRLAGTWGTVHLSCHGRFDDSDPFGSRIHLADGPLTARRIMTMPINAGLVVLSACETGASANSGFGGLGPALLYAGARSAILTLWPTDMDLTRTVMEAFHRRRQSGMGTAEALRATVLELRVADGDPASWAPYILLGSP